MDVSKELNESSTKKSFFKHVFDIEDDSQKEIMNIVQYSLLAIVPILLLNKTVQTFFPEADESKNNMELLFEIAGQTVVMFLGMLIVHRLVTYVPTYSKVDYSPLRVTNVVISFLTIVLSIQSRIGEKANILLDRLLSYLRPSHREPAAQTDGQSQGQNNGFSGGGNVPLPHIPPNGDYQLPSQVPQMAGTTPGQQQQQGPGDYGLLNPMMDDIMAANESGSLWGSAF